MLFAHIKVGEAIIPVGSGLPYLYSGDWMSPFVLLIRDGLGRISSPLLGFLSGYFLLGHLQRRGYFGVLWRRFQTLYLPCVFWSAICILVMLLLIDLVYGRSIPVIAG